MMEHTKLSPEEVRRYNRHLMLPEVGMDGQQKLKNARVLLVGAGGLGAPTALYLAAAGIGTIGIIDFDVVEENNLQRQVIHRQDSVGHSKVSSAIKTIKALNPHVHVIGFEEKFCAENAEKLIQDFDIVCDGTDNFAARYLLNDACMMLDKPYVYGSIFCFDGQVSVFQKGKGPCYRCLYPDVPRPGVLPSSAEVGVFGVLPGIVGTIQANEVIMALLGIGHLLIGRLLLINTLTMQFDEMKVLQNPDCPSCGDKAIIKLVDIPTCYEVQKVNSDIEEVTPQELKIMMDERDDIVFLDVREPHETKNGTLLGAVLVPLGDVLAGKAQLDASKTTILVCRSGARSARAMDYLKQQGFKGRLINLKGGMNAWAQGVD